jgi:hypothetical protein
METRLHENVYLPATASSMFYDLNIPWRTPDDELRRSIAFLDYRKLSILTKLTPSGLLSHRIQCHSHWQTAIHHRISKYYQNSR